MATSVLGRQAELDALGDALDHEDLVVVVGPAGMGKTTVVRAAVADRDHRSGWGLSMLLRRPYVALETAMGRRFVGPAEEVADAILAAAGGATLVIEDVHWVHDSTLDVVELVAERLPVVLTARPQVSDRGHRLLATARCIVLDPLPTRTADRLARRLHPHLDEDQRRELLLLAGGNPLLVERLVVSEDTVSPTLEAAVTERVARLAIDDRRICGLIALLGRPTEPRLLGRSTYAPAGDMATLVEVLDDGRLSLRHAALGAAVISLLEPTERRNLHAELAQLLDDSEGAPHAIAAGDLVRGAERALEAAARTDDVATRAELYRLAADAVTADGGDADQLRVKAATAFADAGQRGDALAQADLVSDRQELLLGDAALQRARAQWFVGDVAAARAELTRAGELVSGLDDERETRVAVERAYLEVRDRSPDSLRLAEEALALADATGVETVRARSTLGAALLYDARPEWEEVLREALEGAQELGDDELAATTAHHLVSGLGFMGRSGESADLAAVQAERSRSAGLRRWSTHIEVAGMMQRLITADDPLVLLVDAERLLPATPLFRNRWQLHLCRGLSLMDLGRFEDAVSAIAELADELGEAPEPIVTHAGLVGELAWHLDDPDLAEAALSEGRQVVDAYFGMHILAERSAGHVLVAHGRSFAPVLPSVAMPAWWPALDELEGLRLLAAGDVKEASLRLEQAADGWKALGYTRWEVRAGTLAADVDPNVRHRGARRRDMAAVARAAGLVGTLRRLGMPVRPELTVMEENVLRLVAAGDTTRQIATRLGIAPATVDQHVDAARRKLGASTRIEAASMVGP